MNSSSLSCEVKTTTSPRSRLIQAIRPTFTAEALADGGDRAQDDVCDSLRLREHDEVRARDLGDRRSSSLGIGAGDIGTGRLVAGCHHRPARQALPGWPPVRLGERQLRHGALGGSQHRGLLDGQVGGEDVVELGRIDPELGRGLAVRSGRIVEGDLGRPQEAVFRAAGDVAQALTLVGCECGHKHQADDVVGHAGSLADQRARIRVADEQNRARV